MILRTIAGVIVGAVLWLAAFTVVGIGFGLMWPAYRAAARVYFQENDFSQFTVAMQATNELVWAIAGVIAGWVAALVGGRRMTSAILAGVCFLYAGVQHYILEWGVLPDAYNVVTPLVIGASIVLGGRFAGRTPHAPAASNQGSPAP